MLTRLIYQSRVLTGVGKSDVENIANYAQDKNRAQSLTGVLFYNQRKFVQVLEGDRAAVNRLFQTISRDTRHTDIEVLQFVDTTQRYFGRWHMRYMGEGILTAELALKYGSTAKIDFNVMSGESVFSLLKEMSEQPLLAPVPDA